MLMTLDFFLFIKPYTYTQISEYRLFSHHSSIPNPTASNKTKNKAIMSNLPSEPEFEQAYKGISPPALHLAVCMQSPADCASHLQSSFPPSKIPPSSKRTLNTRPPSRSLPSPNESFNFESSGKTTRDKCRSTEDTVCNSTPP